MGRRRQHKFYPSSAKKYFEMKQLLHLSMCLMLLSSCEKENQESVEIPMINEELVSSSVHNSQYLASVLHAGYIIYDDEVECDSASVVLFLNAEKRFAAGHNYRHRIIKSLLWERETLSSAAIENKLKLVSLSVDTLDFGSMSTKLTPMNLQEEIVTWQTDRQISLLQLIYTIDQLNTTILVEFYARELRPYYFCNISY